MNRSWLSNSPGVAIISDIDELSGPRGAGLLVFAGYKQGRGAHQLQLGSQHRHLAEEAINIGDGEVEGLRGHIIVNGHRHKPVNKDGTHFVTDVILVKHIMRLRTVSQLGLAGAGQEVLMIPLDSFEARLAIRKLDFL